MPPCLTCPKIRPSATRKTWREAETLSEKNQQAYHHYLECKAVGQFPDDPIVRRNAAIIRRIEDEYDRFPLVQLTSLLVGKLDVADSR